jgi:hypothetical protein
MLPPEFDLFLVFWLLGGLLLARVRPDQELSGGLVKQVDLRLHGCHKEAADIP